VNKKYEHLLMTSTIYWSGIDKEFNFETVCLLYSASYLGENRWNCHRCTIPLFHI